MGLIVLSMCFWACRHAWLLHDACRCACSDACASLPLCPSTRYGLGQVLFRQEKYADALYHFKTAVGINPRSSVLHCYVGMAMHRSMPDRVQHTKEALTRLQVGQGGRKRAQQAGDGDVHSLCLCLMIRQEGMDRDGATWSCSFHLLLHQDLSCTMHQAARLDLSVLAADFIHHAQGDAWWLRPLPESSSRA